MEFRYRDILKEPVEAVELQSLAREAQIPISSLLNAKSKTFKDLKLAASSLTEEQIAELIAANPKAMVRPLLSDGSRLAVGFDPEEFARLV